MHVISSKGTDLVIIDFSFGYLWYPLEQSFLQIL